MMMWGRENRHFIHSSVEFGIEVFLPIDVVPAQIIRERCSGSWLL